ncbi:hypothetical protein V7S43_007282 [Phytophthora oleae]|uniref:Uncharacterized protein n=1 Tax=Phytophthora oleae TaxID=2107226 RepID=A0ABD3FRX5_9STRA
MYHEIYRRACSKSPPLLRQVLLKDVCEVVAVKSYGSVSPGWIVLLFFKFLAFVVPLGGSIMLLMIGSEYSEIGRAYLGSDAASLIIWFFSVIFCCRVKPTPEIVFGTRCHFSVFAIRIMEKPDRIRFLEEITMLVSKNQ